jgi:hypothetical protein
MQETPALPFGLLHRESATVDRGYGIYPPSWKYDPETQVTDLYRMGSTDPTTRCSIASTGIVNSDSDEGDDTGKD